MVTAYILILGSVFAGRGHQQPAYGAGYLTAHRAGYGHTLRELVFERGGIFSV